MAYNKEKIYKQALEIAENKNHFFIEDVIALLPCCSSTFWEFFPAESDELENIKSKLYNNKVLMKVKLRNDFQKGNSSAEKLALYKLICGSEERKSLSMNYTDVTSGDKPLEAPMTIIYNGKNLDISK